MPASLVDWYAIDRQHGSALTKACAVNQHIIMSAYIQHVCARLVYKVITFDPTSGWIESNKAQHLPQITLFTVCVMTLNKCVEKQDDLMCCRWDTGAAAIPNPFQTSREEQQHEQQQQQQQQQFESARSAKRGFGRPAASIRLPINIGAGPSDPSAQGVSSLYGLPVLFV